MRPGPFCFFANPGEPKSVKFGIQDLAKDPTGVVRGKPPRRATGLVPFGSPSNFAIERVAVWR